MSPRQARRSPGPRSPALAVVWALLGAGCEQPTPALPPPTLAPSSTGSAAPIRPLADVRVLLDGVRTPDVPATRLESWPPLELVLPPGNAPGRWSALELVIGEARPPVRIERPHETYPGQVVALLPGASGASVGIFPPAALAARGKPTLEIPGVREVRVILAPAAARSRSNGGDGGGDGGGERIEPATVTLSLSDRGGKRTLDRTTLDALPARTAPLGDTEAKGWSLADLLGAAKAKPGKRWLLVDESGAKLELAATDLAPDRGFGFLKLNRQGQLRFKWFVRQGDAWRPAGDLRGLTSITALR